MIKKLVLPWFVRTCSSFVFHNLTRPRAKQVDDIQRLQIECIMPEVSTDVTRLESRFEHSWKGVEETPHGSSRTELIEVFCHFLP